MQYNDYSITTNTNIKINRQNCWGPPTSGAPITRRSSHPSLRQCGAVGQLYGTASWKTQFRLPLMEQNNRSLYCLSFSQLDITQSTIVKYGGMVRGPHTTAAK